MKALICGHGRAGQRHEKLLKARGIKTHIYDKFKVSTVPTGSPSGFDFCVIATPPSQHLHQLRNCALYGIPTMVEKPLCSYHESFDDLLAYEKVSVAYNYRYHPAVRMLKEQTRSHYEKWFFFSEQHRSEIPKWGVTLDHLPHTLDMLYYLSGHQLKPLEVYTTYSSVTLEGEVDGEQVTIIDRIVPMPIAKLAFIMCPFGYTDIEKNSSMFDLMWDDFLAGEYTGLESAKIVQDTLNATKSIATKRSVAL